MGHKLPSIIHTIAFTAKESSGPSYSVTRLCESLIQQGNTVKVAALIHGHNDKQSDYLNLFEIGFGPKRLGRSPAMRIWLEGQAKNRAVQVFHTHGLWMMPNVYPGVIAKKRDIPLVVSPRGCFTKYAIKSGSIIKNLFWPIVQRPSISSAACFHATAEAEYMDIRRMGFQQPVTIIPNGIDIHPIEPKKTGQFRTLLFLGRIHPNKGLDLLLTAWQQMQGEFKNWRLVIAGNDRGYYGVSGHLEEMRELALKLKLERVEFMGELLAEEKVCAYQEAELFVLPTYSENFGMTVAEALAAAVPVITTKGAPWSGLVAKKAGWWTDIGIEPLVGALGAGLSCSTDTLAAMGLRGRDWMKSDFSWEKVGVMMSETYEWILKRKNKPEHVNLD